MNRRDHPRSSLAEPDLQRLLDEVSDGLRSVRRAAADLDWTMEEVQLVIWGEVRL